MTKKDSPGVKIPPPLIYAAIFLLSLLLQRLVPWDRHLLATPAFQVAGWVWLGCFAVCTLPALWKFLRTRNTVVTVLPARSLATSGIYRVTRNPMYLGLLFLYAGLGVFRGNWWTFALLPLVVLIVQQYIILREEHYLERAFGEQYAAYKLKVRRWL
ncbi:MAG TPA: isoprenylcysteine carboxylmethyltransferase family protein [Chitinophagaceae bacterium]|nr:isoprenylcysteine carboxylmethyltransferase family protein [Chitinophagaceae bacterium]